MNDKLTTLFLVKGFCQHPYNLAAIDSLAEEGVGETVVFHHLNELGATLDKYQPQAKDPLDFLYGTCENAGRWITGFAVSNDRLPTHEEFEYHLSVAQGE